MYTDSEREDELLMAEEVEKARNTITDYWKTKSGLSKGTYRAIGATVALTSENKYLNCCYINSGEILSNKHQNVNTRLLNLE